MVCHPLQRDRFFFHRVFARALTGLILRAGEAPHPGRAKPRFKLRAGAPGGDGDGHATGRKSVAERRVPQRHDRRRRRSSRRITTIITHDRDREDNALNESRWQEGRIRTNERAASAVAAKGSISSLESKNISCAFLQI